MPGLHLNLTTDRASALRVIPRTSDDVTIHRSVDVHMQVSAPVNDAPSRRRVFDVTTALQAEAAKLAGKVEWDSSRANAPERPS